jgi:hypothetical protein
MLRYSVVASADEMHVKMDRPCGWALVFESKGLPLKSRAQSYQPKTQKSYLYFVPIFRFLLVLTNI